MAAKRRYELKRRAEQVDETRRRIVEATVELHRTVGPASTSISEVAERAGVQRRTVYNHFRDDRSLFAACSAHWRSLHPAPDPNTWLAVRDRRERIRRALAELYGWYRETEPMTAHVLRDAQLLPGLRAVVEPGLGAYLETVRGVLLEASGARGRKREEAAAVVSAVSDLHVWRALAPLGDERAAELAARLLASV